LSPASLHGYSICADVSFRVLPEGILASNHRARQHVLLNLPLFNALVEDDAASGELCAWDRTRFSNVDGLLADPTCLREGDLGEPARFSTREAAWRYLADRFVLVRDPAEYEAHFAVKTSLIDRKHLGTFHQRLGAELRLRERIDPDVWWYGQKFDPETGRVRDNLYRFVQQAFLDDYIGSLPLEGRRVLDFGCGAGMASRLFTARGARVTGVDPDPAQLEKAALHAGVDFEPVQLLLSSPEPLAAVPEGPFDLVWLADVLLFYFYPQDAGEPIMTAADLLRQLGDRLASGARLVIMMPHGVFWLAPWLGDARRPYTVLTEYANRLYSVAPGLSEICDAIERAGLCIRSLREPRPAEAGRSVDARAFHFAENFPLWWVFECLKTP
jgi:SAM-dependent methyltransferase